jgi:hypothetical protein
MGKWHITFQVYDIAPPLTERWGNVGEEGVGTNVATDLAVANPEPP